MAEGAKKYGAYNWRSKRVLMTVYIAAIQRHLAALADGEDCDTDSQAPHLGHILACAAILADAQAGGWLEDDRPPAGPAAALLALHTTPYG